MANGEADFAIFIWRGGEGFFMDTKKWRLWCHTLEPGSNMGLKIDKTIK